MLSAKELYQNLLADIDKEFDGKVIIEKKTKDSFLWRALAVVLFFNKRFLSGYYTTIGPIIGTPTTWEERSYENRYSVLRHEREHLRQYKRAGFGNLWLGFFLVGFLYVFIPFPIGIAWFRAHFEKEAYRESMRAEVALYGSVAARARLMSSRRRDHRVKTFTGPDYLYMWPFPKAIRKWYDKTVDEVIEETNT